MCPLPPHMHGLPHYQIPHQSGTFVTTDEPAFMVHSWLHMVHIKITLQLTLGVAHSVGFNKYKMAYLPLNIAYLPIFIPYSSLWYHTEYFYCSKNPLLQHYFLNKYK